jgi:hypothetical protein
MYILSSLSIAERRQSRTHFRNKHGMRASRLARAKAEKACDSAKKAGASRRRVNELA